MAIQCPGLTEPIIVERDGRSDDELSKDACPFVDGASEEDPVLVETAIGFTLSTAEILAAMLSLVSGSAGGAYLGAISRGRFDTRDEVRSKHFPRLAAHDLLRLNDGLPSGDSRLKLEVSRLVNTLPYVDRYLYAKYLDAVDAAMQAPSPKAEEEVQRRIKQFNAHLMRLINPTLLSRVRSLLTSGGVKVMWLFRKAPDTSQLKFAAVRLEMLNAVAAVVPATAAPSTTTTTAAVVPRPPPVPRQPSESE